MPGSLIDLEGISVAGTTGHGFYTYTGGATEAPGFLRRTHSTYQWGWRIQSVTEGILTAFGICNCDTVVAG